jgi:hypothetical protein
MRHQKINFEFETLDRETKSALLKGFLKELGLTPPANLGNIEEGTPEIVSLTDVYSNGKFFADFEVGVRWKAGANPAPFVMRSNYGGAGAVFVPIIDGKIALVRQWRPCLGRFTWEIPRGFSETWETGKKLGAASIPKGFATVLGELSEEVGKATDVVPTFLGEIAENSGSTTTSPSYWILKIGKMTLGGSEEGINVKLVPLDEIPELVGKDVVDSHSITALYLAQKHLRA